MLKFVLRFYRYLWILFFILQWVFALLCIWLYFWDVSMWWAFGGLAGSFLSYLARVYMRGLVLDDFRKWLVVDPLKAKGLNGKERRRIRRAIARNPKFKKYVDELLQKK